MSPWSVNSQSLTYSLSSLADLSVLGPPDFQKRSYRCPFPLNV